MSQCNDSISKTLLNKIDGEIDGSQELIGNAMGANNLPYQTRCLLSAYELLDSAQAKINIFLKYHNLPVFGKTTSVMVPPNVVDADYEDVQPEMNTLGHRDGCNYNMFATECNCDYQQSTSPVIESAKKLLEHIAPKSIEQDDSVIPVKEDF